MAYVITQPCIDVRDRSCQDVCPVDCIYDEPDKDRMLFINPDECIDCGACEPVCPVAAIFVQDAVPEQWKDFIAVNRLYFTDPTAARDKVNALAEAPGAQASPQG